LTPSGANRLRLSLIRGFELHLNDSVIPVARSVERLVAFLALQRRAVRRLHASGVLWTDASESRASSSLRSALWRTPSPGGFDVIQTTSTHLWINPAVYVDFQEITDRAVALVEGSYSDSLPGLASTMRLFGDDLLPDWYEDWVLVERERFRQLRLHALEALCEKLTDLGRYAPAIEAGLAAVACEPLRESAQRQLIRAHLAEGNVGEAVRQYRSYANLLAAELGAKPSASLTRIIDECLNCDAGEVRR
jgi:DNA-binding SARP family transcriptional activator